MSTTPQAPISPLDVIVREDVVEALIDQKMSRSTAEAAVRGASGVTFSELYRSALEWANRSKGQAVPAMRPQIIPSIQPKEKPVETQTISAKTNGHAPARTCTGFERECSESIPPKNTSGLCTRCYARKIYRQQNPPKAGKATAALAKTSARQSLTSAPPVAARVALEVTEAQLNTFLVKLSFADKQRLANHYLQTAE